MTQEVKEIAKNIRTTSNVVMRDKSVMGDDELKKPTTSKNQNLEEVMESDPILKEFKQNMAPEVKGDAEEVKVNDKFKEEKAMPISLEQKVNELKNGHIVVIGMGAGGANVAHLAKKEGFMTCAVNTSKDDVSGIDVDHTFIFEQSFGSGKERKRSKEKFIENADAFINFFGDNFSGQTGVIIVHTAGGGTGGGSGPMAAKFIKDNYPDKNVFLIVMQGSIKEDIKSQENMASVMEEISKAGVNYLMFDNDRAVGCIDNVYSVVNNEVVDAIKFISREYFVENTRSNIDLTDMQKLYIDNKRMVIVSGNFDRKVSGDGDYQQQMINAVNGSTQLPPNGSPMSYAFFLNVEERIYNEIDTNFRKISDVFGESYETYKHFQPKIGDGPDFTIVLTGLPECVERYDLINRRISEFNERKVNTRTLGDVEKVTITGRQGVDFKLPSEEKSKPSSVNKSAFDSFT